MARLWDKDMADRAAAIDQATRLGGIVVQPPKVKAGFDRSRPEPEHSGSHGSHLPGQPDEEF